MTNLQAVNFCGKANETVLDAEIVEDEKKPKKHYLTSAATKLTKPVADDFHKAYDNAPASPSLVADYASDKLVKTIALVGGTALILAKARKSTNGLTTALKTNIQNFGKAANGEKSGIVKSTVALVKNTLLEVKKNNSIASSPKLAEEFTEAAKKKPVSKIIKDALLRPTNFSEEGALANVINRAVKNPAKNAAVKDKLAKVGIGSAEQLVDTALAVGSTAVLSHGVGSIASDVTVKDNEQLAYDAKVKHFNDTLETVGKFADMADILTNL